MSVREFADKLMVMVRMSPVRFRYGSDKVPIYRAWQLSHQTSGFPKMRLREFKELVKLACQDGWVYLTQAYPSKTVHDEAIRKSKLQWECDGQTVTSHFILIT